MRAAVGERDDTEHAAEHGIRHLLLRRRVDEHDGRALAGGREEGSGDGERERRREREEAIARAGTSTRRASPRAPCGGSAPARAKTPATIEPAAYPAMMIEKPPAPWCSVSRTNVGTPPIHVPAVIVTATPRAITEAASIG